jgi:hypothetical protein
VNILIIADGAFIRREGAMLSRLETGLIGEGVQVIRAVPAGCSSVGTIAVRTVEFQERGLGFTRGLRAAQLIETISEPRSGLDGPIDAVHAFGLGSWPIAAETAARFGAGLAYEVWCAGLCGRATAVRAAATGRGPSLMLSPDAAIERALFRQGIGASVRIVPWGVPVPAQPRRILEPGRALGVMVVGPGSDRASFAAAIEGLSRAVQTRPEVMIFADAGAARAAEVWPLVRRLGLADRLTLAPDMEALRRLTLSGDILVIPEPSGEHRSLVLEAMASGLAVVAAADPMVSHLADRRTARLVAGADAGLWEGTLRDVLDDAPAARSLAASARQYVGENHRVTAHVGLVLDAYEWLASRDSIPMRRRGT